MNETSFKKAKSIATVATIIELTTEIVKNVSGENISTHLNNSSVSSEDMSFIIRNYIKDYLHLDIITSNLNPRH